MSNPTTYYLIFRHSDEWNGNRIGSGDLETMRFQLTAGMTFLLVHHGYKLIDCNLNWFALKKIDSDKAVECWITDNANDFRAGSKTGREQS